MGVTCEDCNKNMTGSVTCTLRYIQLGDEFFERNTVYFDVNKKCHDCGIINKDGNIHHYGCDMERCPRCEGQMLSCGCYNSECNETCGNWYSEGCDKDHAGSLHSTPPNGKITSYTKERKKRIMADRAKEMLSLMKNEM